jgi:asparagine synthase (glutamine-hydrolysing)
MSFERIVEEAGALFQDAVKIRLRADVPVGCYLSGGLDSSGISACVANKFNHNVKTFGIRFNDKAFDESRFQKCMVSSLGTEHADILVNDDDINDSLSDTLWHVENPLLRSGPIPLFLLSKIVQQHQLKVVLTGEGADEVFGGYNIFRETKVRNFWSKYPNSKFRGLLIARLYPYIFKDARLGGMQLSFFKNGLERSLDPLFSHYLRWNNTGKTKQFLSDAVLNGYEQEEAYENIKSKLPADFNRWDYLAKAQYLEMKIFLNKYLLSSQGDRVAMAHSVEMRMPFLDYRIIEFMGRIPSEHKIRGLNEKYILKKILAGSLPDEIVNRPKQPYRAPFGQAIVNSKNMQLNNAVSERSLKKSGLFNETKVMKFIDKSKSKKALSEVDTMALMGIYSTQLIYEKFIENFPDSPSLSQEPALCVDMRRNSEVA